MPIIFIRKATPTDPVLQAAARMEPKLAQAFIDAVKAMKDSVSLAKLEAAIAKGDVNEALAVVSLDKKFVAFLKGEGLEPGILSFQGAIEATYAAGAAAALGHLPSAISVNLAFDLKSPESLSFLEKYEFDLIKQLTTETTEAIREVIMRAFSEGGHPYEQAREIKSFIGLTTRQEQAVANFRNSLSDTSTLRDALSRSLRDGRFDSTLTRALQNGTNLTPEQIERMTERYQERYVQYRAQTIARTESIRASSKGRTELWREAKAQGLLGDDAMREWEVSGDDRTCDECDSLDGKVAELDEEFAPGIFEPPDPHPDCRCSVKLVFGKSK